MAEKSTAISPIEKRRREIFQAMNEELRKVAMAMEGRISKASVGIVTTRYDIGAMILEVTNRENTYGTRAVEQLAEYRNESANTLYALRDFADSFDREYVIEWTGKPMADGGFLTEKHWMAVRQLSKRSDQEKFLSRALDESLSANALALVVSASNIEKKKIGRGGRKASRPSSPLDGLQKFGKLAQTFVNYEDQQMEPAVFDAIDEMAPDAIDETLLSRLVSTLKEIEEADKCIDNAKARLVSNLERVKEVLGSRAVTAEAATKKKAKASDEEEAPAKKKKAKPAEEEAPAKKKAKPTAAEEEAPAKKKKVKPAGDAAPVKKKKKQKETVAG